MPTSTYKGYELQTTGSNIGTWGTTLNNQALSYVDQNMGGITTATLSASNIVLSDSDSRNAILRLTGTLLANVTVTTSALGFFFVENLTSGNFTVSIRNTNIATAATVPQGTRATLISDATNGVRIASNDGFVSGTTLTFLQSSAPSGWTKSTTATLNNAALRIVTSSGGGTGGSANFTDAFAARTIAQANLPNISITGATTDTRNETNTENKTLTGSMYAIAESWARSGSVSNGGVFTKLGGTYNSSATPSSIDTSNAGAVSIDVTHSHNVSVSLGGSGTALDFAVKYVDAIICVKD